MRTTVLVSLVVLAAIALLGVVGSILIVGTTIDAIPPLRDESVRRAAEAAAIASGAGPFLVGVVALAGAGIILAINQQREEQVSWLAHIGRAGGAR